MNIKNGNHQALLISLILTVVSHLLFFAIPVKTNKINTITAVTEISIYLEATRPETNNSSGAEEVTPEEQPASNTQKTNATNVTPDDLKHTQTDILTEQNENIKDTSNQATLSTSTITHTAIRTFIDNETTNEHTSSYSSKDPFTQNDYVDDLKYNPIDRQNHNTQVESYTNIEGTHISIESNGSAKCFTILNDEFSQSDFAPAPQTLTNLTVGCGSNEPNLILQGLEERENR